MLSVVKGRKLKKEIKEKICMKLFKRLACVISIVAILLAFGDIAPRVEAVEGRSSADWNERISEFQVVSVSSTNKRPALTMIVQNFLSAYSTRWSRLIVDAGGLDGYFGSTTKQCVEEYQSEHSLYVDGAVGKNTWHQIGRNLSDIDPSNGYIFFTRGNSYILRALKNFPYTFYYPTFNYGDIQWNTIPTYND